MPDIERYSAATAFRTTQTIATLVDDGGAELADFFVWEIDRTGAVDVGTNTLGESGLVSQRSVRFRWDARIVFGSEWKFSDDLSGSTWRVSSEPATVGRRGWLEVDLTSETVGSAGGPLDIVVPGRVLLGSDFVKEPDAYYDPHYSYPICWVQGQEIDLVQYADYGDQFAPNARAFFGAAECHRYPVSDYMRYDNPGSGSVNDAPIAAGRFRMVWRHSDGTTHAATNAQAFQLRSPTPGKTTVAMELQTASEPSAPSHSQGLALLADRQTTWPEPAVSKAFSYGENGQEGEPILIDNAYDPSTGTFRTYFSGFERRIIDNPDWWGENATYSAGSRRPDVDYGTWSFEKWRLWHMTNDTLVSPTLRFGTTEENSQRDFFYVRDIRSGSGPKNWNSNVQKSLWVQNASGRLQKLAAFAHPTVVGDRAGDPFLITGGSISHWRFFTGVEARLDSPIWLGVEGPGNHPSRWLITSVHG